MKKNPLLKLQSIHKPKIQKTPTLEKFLEDLDRKQRRKSKGKITSSEAKAFFEVCELLWNRKDLLLCYAALQPSIQESSYPYYDYTNHRDASSNHIHPFTRVEAKKDRSLDVLRYPTKKFDVPDFIPGAEFSVEFSSEKLSNPFKGFEDLVDLSSIVLYENGMTFKLTLQAV